MKDPAWFTAKVDQRMALLEHKLPDLIKQGMTMVMTPLTEPAEDTKVALDYWERSCDNCGTYCAPGQDFYTGTRQRKLSNGIPVYITFGVCKVCRLHWDQ